MKKIFILPILIAPIMAHATDPVGPAHVNSGAVIATASAPYATATPETGDTTNVVSASYVKGAYNDAIAAVNKVNSDLSNLSSYVNNDIEDEIGEIGDQINDIENDISDLQNQVDDKQDKIFKSSDSEEIEATAMDIQMIDDIIRNTDIRTTNNGYVYYAYPASQFDDYLVTAGAVLTAFNDHKVKAVTTWGNDTNTTNLSLTPTNR